MKQVTSNTSNWCPRARKVYLPGAIATLLLLLLLLLVVLLVLLLVLLLRTCRGLSPRAKGETLTRRPLSTDARLASTSTCATQP
jgi:hypothetical protein